MLLSVLSAAGVRRDLLHAAGQAGVLTVGGDPLSGIVVDAALGRLAEGSLLAFSLDGQAVRDHQLVLRVVRERLVQQGRPAAVCRAAASVLEAHAGALAGSQDRAAVRDVPEQVTALRQAAAGLAGSSAELEATPLRMRLLARYHLNDLGDSMAQAIASGEPLPKTPSGCWARTTPNTLTSRNDRATAYRQAGRVAEAIPLHQQSLADHEWLLGPDHPDTLQSRNNLALAYQEAGRLAKRSRCSSRPWPTWSECWAWTRPIPSSPGRTTRMPVSRQARPGKRSRPRVAP